MASPADSDVWPGLPLDEWIDTYATLHLWTQVVGKTRLALSPAENHWWHVTLHVTARGLATPPMTQGRTVFDVELDLVEHRLVIRTDRGDGRTIALRPQTVADFYRQYMAALRDLGVAVRFRHPAPDEVEHPIPFADDTQHKSYNADHVTRFWRVLVQADRLMRRFHGRFLGKSSPVHFFWGAFDLSLTRFSGRRGPDQPEAGAMMREAMSHEEFSIGFWPGSGAVREPAFYAYVRPEPVGFPAAPVRPSASVYQREIANFILPYERVRTGTAPDQMVLEFFQSTYEAAADLSGWDRRSLDRPPSEWP
jgi:hypothetical protein